ncbi:histone deacetylase 11-like isoform X2 [Pomacea canaliculata]|nr:histone deacetylase 11-like isoform X2 [Pomacea canaliculata]
MATLKEHDHCYAMAGNLETNTVKYREGRSPQTASRRSRELTQSQCARLHTTGVLVRAVHTTRLYIDVRDDQWPIVYCSDYNISFLGLEKLHPFDAGKWGRVIEFLKKAGMVRDDTLVVPVEASEEDLRVVHSSGYLSSLKWSITVAGITEVPPVALLPNFIVQRKVLRPLRFQTGGTILAAKLAVERGWALNVGGGFHHCSADKGGGFCAYADITLALRFLFDRVEGIAKAMIVDLDAHQGNGHERDFMNDERVYIMDVFNRGIYPHDGFAKRAIRKKVELEHFTDDREYLHKVHKHLEEALVEFTPDILLYNAGTDILDGDPLGCLSISPQGIIERDQIVFEKARARGIPILMVTSGGYQRATARIIADSILNLQELKLISCDEAEQSHSSSSVLESNKLGALPRSRSESLVSRLRSCVSHSSTSQDLNKEDERYSVDKPDSLNDKG